MRNDRRTRPANCELPIEEDPFPFTFRNPKSAIRNSLFVHHCQIGELAKLVLNSQSVSEHKLVGHLKGREVRFNVNASLSWFIYENAGAQGFHPASGEVPGDVIERHACCYNPVDQQYVASAGIELACEDDLALTAVPVVGYLHKAATDRNIESANQVGQEDECVVEYPNDREITSRSAGADFIGKCYYAVLYFLF
jgi:hypothetical protein